MSDPMKTRLQFCLRYCLRAEDTTKEMGHSNSDVVFFFWRLSYLVFLHSFHRSDFIETNKSGGQQTACLKNGCALIKLSSQDLQRRIKADAKNRNIVLVNRYF